MGLRFAHEHEKDRADDEGKGDNMVPLELLLEIRD
jgi:hypothetical protein